VPPGVDAFHETDAGATRIAERQGGVGYLLQEPLARSRLGAREPQQYTVFRGVVRRPRGTHAEFIRLCGSVIAFHGIEAR
jgi:hypothetical protein